MVLDGLSLLAAADPTALAAQAQAECLQTLEQADAIATAARARILAAFTAGHGYSADADYSPACWLIHRTRITKGAARGHLGWARRAAAHPGGDRGAGRGDGAVGVDGPADLRVDRTSCPEDCRDAADGILLTAARGGARTEDLAALAAEIYARSLPDDRGRPGTILRGPAAAGGDHVRRRGGDRRGPHPRVRRGGDRGAGGAVGAGRGAGHPDQGPAVPRRAGRRDAPPGRQRVCCRSGPGSR